MLQNEYVRVFDVRVPAGQATQLHQHLKDDFWIGLDGDAALSNDVAGQPPAPVTSIDGGLHFSRGGYAHIVRNPGATAFHNITIELRQPQGEARNRCAGPVVPGIPVATNNCDPNEIFATTRTQVYRLTVPSGGVAAKAFPPGADLLVPIAGVRVNGVKLPAGTPLWLDHQAPQLEPDQPTPATVLALAFHFDRHEPPLSASDARDLAAGCIPVQVNPWDEGENQFAAAWFSADLRAMGEPNLVKLAADPNAVAYRLMILPTWNNAIAVRVQGVGEHLSLSARRLDRSSGFGIGKLIERQDTVLTADDARSLQSLIQRLNFSSMPVRDNVNGEDGTIWVFEGVSNGRYHVIDRSEADDSHYHPSSRGLTSFLAFSKFLLEKSHLSERATQ